MSTMPTMLTSRYAGRALAAALAADSNYVPLRTSLGAPRFRLPYKVAGAVKPLMPDRAMLGLPREEYEPLYRAKLDRLGVDAIRREIAAASGDGVVPVLLCFCDLDAGCFCHRRIFADWWLEKTGERVPEM